ncbi:MAG: hypothetical protein ACREWG_16300 [Gammaproteobacteria bacterium]
MEVLAGEACKRGKTQMWREALSNTGVWMRACRLGMSVGLLQALVNQGDHWLSGAVTLSVAVKSLLTPLITVSVALVSGAATYVERHRDEDE